MYNGQLFHDKNGIDVKVQIFSEHKEDAWKINHINRWYAEN